MKSDNIHAMILLANSDTTHPSAVMMAAPRARRGSDFPSRHDVPRHNWLHGGHGLGQRLHVCLDLLNTGR
jgi:hypothetical protein